MKHTRSSAEVEIRDAVVARFRELWPNARIIHEMNVEHGGSRADVVAVQPDRLWICEIKSEKDKLDRLAGQMKDFVPVCHGVIIAAHEKWTKQPPMVAHPKIAGVMTSVPSLLDAATRGLGHKDVWSYPEQATPYGRQWRAPYRDRVPWHYRMLMLLWTDELRAVANIHRISCNSRTPGHHLLRELSRMMTGHEIEQAVCRMLRIRAFAEADAPFTSEYATATAPVAAPSLALFPGGISA